MCFHWMEWGQLSSWEIYDIPDKDEEEEDEQDFDLHSDTYKKKDIMLFMPEIALL